MMDVTVSGIHLADNVWTTALDYLNEGHAVWVDPSDGGNTVASTLNASTFSAYMGAPPSGSAASTVSNSATALGYNVLKAEVCMLGKDTTLRPQMMTGQSTNGLYYSKYVFPFIQ